MNDHALHAISPVDGRYAAKTEALRPYLSEYALMKYRVTVEVEYLIALLDTLHLTDDTDRLRTIVRDFSTEDARTIKETERVTNHDVKAVEYFVKDRLADHGLDEYREFVHFGLTSQDVNNTALPMMVRDAHAAVLRPALDEVVADLRDMADRWADVPMLARTHGQPASPTRLGKEVAVFVERIERQLAHLDALEFSGKFGGATGNFNAHHVAYPHHDWPGFADRFLRESLGLRRQRTTTQIEHYDDLAAFFQAWMRIDTILIDLCRDIWTYVSMDYFGQRVAEGEVGSSAMPHKVNPIDFENAEGNLGVANALFGHLAAKLPVSRLQRDLTDSTVTRTIGVPMGHVLIALTSVRKGLGKLTLNDERLRADLEANWAVVAEAIQNVLRREGVPNPYEQLKALTRGQQGIDRTRLHTFIDQLDVRDAVKDELKAITPHTYTGM